MFKFLKDKLKNVVGKFSKEVKEEKEEIKEEEVKITYFVHGTTIDNEKEIATGWNPGELSESGKRQSIELREQIKDRKFDIVFCSDLKRAVDSAELIFQDIQIIQDKRLRECNYGNLNGADRKEVEYLESVNKSFPNGESLKDVENRIANFLNYLFEKYKGKHVAIVSHRAPQLAIEVLLKRKTWEQAIDEDWRLKGKWQPGWDYDLKSKIKILKKTIFEKIKDRVTKTVISSKNFNKFFDELEIVLLENNVALEVIEKIKEDLSKEIVDKPLSKGKIEEIIKDNLKKSINSLFDVEKIDLLSRVKDKKPYVICFVGINGSGKTTSMAKVAYYLMKNKLTCVFAASDTFRAASIEQLKQHADKLNIKMIKHDYGSDPAAVAFDAIKYASAKNIDVVLIDTAGRMHSNVNLMEELKKVVKVAKPDLVIFVGESITGNDCIEQAKKFNEGVNIDGIILTKLDIDEKGGAAISVSYVTKKPILFIGNGQSYDDLEFFDAKEVIKSLGF